MPSGRTIRLRYDIDKWLSSIDESKSLAVALNIVKAGYTDHKDLEAQHEQIKDAIRELKQ